MNTSQQPEALRLAETLEQYALSPLREVAAELRRQHDRIVELEAERAAIIAEKNEYKYALRHAQNELEA